jgi:hypothetical protein
MMIIHKKTNIDRPNRGLEALHFARLCDVTGVQRTKMGKNALESAVFPSSITRILVPGGKGS